MPKSGALPYYTSSHQRKDGRAAAVPAQQVALRPRALSAVLRQRARPRSPGPSARAAAPPAATPGPPGSARAVRPTLGLSRARVLPRATGRSAIAGAMALPRAQARGWVKAAKLAQRRRPAEDTGGAQSPAPGSQRAALYVHVSGEGGGVAGAEGRGPPWRLSRRGPTCRPSPARGERGLGPVPWQGKVLAGELKSLVLTISSTLTSDFPSEPQFSPTEVGLLVPLERCVA